MTGEIELWLEGVFCGLRGVAMIKTCEPMKNVLVGFARGWDGGEMGPEGLEKGAEKCEILRFF